jgi:acetyl esterase/lipase
MLARHGIGAVMINYRLSPQVKHPEHIKDVARAFAWTHKHIAEYGGRPDRLLVSGHSAGGHLAALLATDESWLRAEGLSLADIRGAVPISGVYSIPPGMFTSVFGSDDQVRMAASPTNQARSGCPPFLILYADRDIPFCDLMSQKLAAALGDKGVAATAQAIEHRNHIDILAKLRFNDDPCAEALRDFVLRQAK